MSYSVIVNIYSDGATYHETVATGDDTPGNVTAVYGLADPLIIKQSLGSGDRLPLTHPEPDEATITLIAPTASTYAALSLGDPVSINLYPQAAFAGTPVKFYGRVATLSAESVDLGTKYTLGCMDYTVDLAEIPVGGTANWPAQTAQFRLGRIMTEAGLGWAFSGFLLSTDPPFPARTKSNSDARVEILNVLDSWNAQRNQDEFNTTYSTAGGIWFMQARPRIVPKITADQLDPDTPFLVTSGVPTTKRVRYSPPARLASAGGIRSVSMNVANSSPTTGTPIIDGARVRFAPAYVQQKGGDGYGNVVTAYFSDGTSFRFDWRTVIGRDIPLNPPGSAWTLGFYATPIQLAGPQVAQNIETGIDSTGDLPPVVENWRVPFRPNVAQAWTVGTMSWQAWSEPSPWRRPELTELLTVSNVEAGVLPTNREWVTGLVRATTVTVEKGRPVIDIELIPNSYDYELQRLLQTSSTGVCSMDSPILSGVLISQINTRDTMDDYALVKGS